MSVKSYISIIHLIIIGLIMFRCHESEDLGPIKQPTEDPCPIEQPSKLIRVSFEHDIDSLREDVDSVLITINLDHPAMADGQISIYFEGSAVYDQDYKSFPKLENYIVNLEILKDSISASFVIYAIGNRPDDLSINMLISDLSEGLTLSDAFLSQVLILQNDVTDVGEKVEINFENSGIQIAENGLYGFNIWMTLSGHVKTVQAVVIKFWSTNNAQYGRDYNIQPLPVLDEITYTVQAGSEVAAFIVFPVNDFVMSDTRQIQFEIISATNGISIGSNSKVTVEVLEDDIQQENIYSISNLRNQFELNSGEFWLAEDYYIEGIITSASNIADNRMVYVQDNNGGILVRFSISTPLKLGDHVQLNLKGGTGRLINDQKAIDGVPNLTGIRLEENQTIIPEIVSLEELASGLYEGLRVQIDNIQFEGADGDLTFGGDHQIINDSFRGIVTIYPSASFYNGIIPSGTWSIIGIVGDWGHILPQSMTTDLVEFDL